ncbi:collagenase [Paraglaciecola arctica]|nr:collagenase [Paraglaciecola arctica]
MRKHSLLMLGLMCGASILSANATSIKPTLNENENIARHHGVENSRLSTSPVDQDPGKPQYFSNITIEKTIKLAAKRSVLAKTAVVAGCTVAADLLSLYDEDLVNAITQGDLSACLYGLYNKGHATTEMFADEKALTVVNAINDRLATYDGTNSSDASELEKLVTFLRAMHWVHNSREFTAVYHDALTLAFSQYFADDNFAQFNGDTTRDFMVRREMMVLLVSSGTDSLAFLPQFSTAILGYMNTVAQHDEAGVYYEEDAMTRLLTELFYASKDNPSGTEAILVAHPEVISNLKQAVESAGTWLIGKKREYQWADTISELGRLLQYPEAIAQQVRPTIQTVLNTYTYDGTGADGWLNAQNMVTTYDNENCELYGDVCDFNLEAAILSGSHTCSATIKVRYQGIINEDNLGGICASLAVKELEFHQRFGTNSEMPVANDNSTDLEVVVFSSWNEYNKYGGNFFDINTDNGGMYLEGTPSDLDNQARFIAHQATWLSEFTVWNLEHEFIHYLDGRFNKWGSFSEQPENSVWWGEGVADYLAKGDNNSGALAVASGKTYQLSELFETTYANSNTERTYSWGYLAVRFMFENHISELENELLPSMRAAKKLLPNTECTFDWSWHRKTEATANNWFWAYDDSEWSTGAWVWTCGQSNEGLAGELPEYTPYQDVLDGWNTRFDMEFHEWLDCLVQGEGVCQTVSTRPADMDENGRVDKNDIVVFTQMLRQPDLNIMYDFNDDGKVDRKDVRAMMKLCDLPRCAVAN